MEDIKKIAELIPTEGMNRIAETLCDTFKELVLPLTATTAGVGQLIQTKFETLNIHQQIIAAKCLQEAKEKVGSRKPNKEAVVKPQVVYEALDDADQQTDDSIRSLWSNLLAREFVDGDVHPEIAKLLTRITSRDALLLLSIAEEEPKARYMMVLKILGSKFSIPDFGKDSTFNHVHLKRLGLITRTENVWCLTVSGREFMRCVCGLEE